MPPREKPHPFLMANPKTIKELEKREFEHAILDCGVEFFKVNPLVKEYPDYFLESWKLIARKYTDIFGEKLWVTIPDYPDDYHPGQFGDNTKKTLNNIEEFISLDGVNWVATIQAKYQNNLQFYDAIHQFKDLVGQYPRIAIGTVCKSKNHNYMVQCLRGARTHFKNSYIHAFGLTLSIIPKIINDNLIDSFDSMAWCYPRKKFKEWCETTGLKPFPNTSPLTNGYSNVFFWDSYIKRLKELKVID